jgi:hypothetical protein
VVPVAVEVFAGIVIVPVPDPLNILLVSVPVAVSKTVEVPLDVPVSSVVPVPTRVWLTQSELVMVNVLVWDAV